ncbi:hypothetical protein [Paenibacillus periandrae]|uniref:hypothetical protein n=1 Tax=Paenibacillus periandrae TaxID=1761741 RepID=UPI001F09E4A7|nr:hypothetical protein [Paenibacillus periandrae]
MTNDKNILNPLEHIMDVEEATKVLGLQPSTVKDLCRLKYEKEGKAIKKGNTWILDIYQNPMEPLKQIMDVGEAVELWGLRPSTIKDYCRTKLEKEGKAIKKGKTWILVKNQPNPGKPDHPKNWRAKKE